MAIPTSARRAARQGLAGLACKPAISKWRPTHGCHIQTGRWMLRQQPQASDCNNVINHAHDVFHQEDIDNLVRPQVGKNSLPRHWRLFTEPRLPGSHGTSWWNGACHLQALRNGSLAGGQQILLVVGTWGLEIPPKFNFKKKRKIDTACVSHAGLKRRMIKPKNCPDLLSIQTYESHPWKRYAQKVCSKLLGFGKEIL